MVVVAAAITLDGSPTGSLRRLSRTTAAFSFLLAIALAALTEIYICSHVANHIDYRRHYRLLVVAANRLPYAPATGHARRAPGGSAQDSSCNTPIGNAFAYPGAFQAEGASWLSRAQTILLTAVMGSTELFQSLSPDADEEVRIQELSGATLSVERSGRAL